MKILSLSEDDSIAREADELCGTIDDHSDQLFNVKSGQSISIGTKKFNCISADKNIIFRVEDKNIWYLKFSLTDEWMQHEIAGADSVKATLSGFKGYQHSKAIRASEENRYTIYTAAYGKTFNRVLLEGCFLRLKKIKETTLFSMETLGKSLGLLHTYKNPNFLKAISPDTISYINDYIRTIENYNPNTEKISKWMEQNKNKKIESAWIHGNIKSEDLFFHNGEVCIIDFGTCGSGNPYEDLTNLCTYMILLRTIPLFPWRNARQALNALLSGYASVRTYDRKELKKNIAQGIFRYYLKNVVMHDGIASLSGMIILRSKIENLISQLVHDDFDTAYEGIRF